MSTLRQQLRNSAAYFSLASSRIARRQAARLIRAKHYLQQRGIDALEVGSKFHYERATGSVLRAQT